MAERELPISEAIEADELTFLRSIRRKLADELEQAPPHAVAQIVAKLRDVDRSIRELERLGNDKLSIVRRSDDDPADDGWREAL